MSQALYVGNLPFTTRPEEVEKAFGRFGTVAQVTFITDRGTGRFRGFCFVVMDDESGALRAVEALDCSRFQGRRMRVAVAKRNTVPA